LLSSGPARQCFAFNGSARLVLFVWLKPVPAPVLIQPPAVTTSSQPPANHICISSPESRGEVDQL
jgi:hypothetical protein